MTKATQTQNATVQLTAEQIAAYQKLQGSTARGNGVRQVAIDILTKTIASDVANGTRTSRKELIGMIMQSCETTEKSAAAALQNARNVLGLVVAK